MGEEPDNHTTRRSTQTAIGAGDIAPLGRAYHYFPTGWSSDGVRGIGWEHHYYGTAVDLRKFVRFSECVRAEVDPESVAVRMPDAGTIAGGLRGVAYHRLVGVSPASFARLCPHQLGEHLGIDVIADSREVAGLIMSPEGTGSD